MSGHQRTPGYERPRCPVHGHGRRLSRSDIGEIRRAIDIENSKARRAGKTPKGPKISVFSCTCNCFSVRVD
jgi:hypothetical protein